MIRRPNRTSPQRPGTLIRFHDYEYAHLKHNVAGPSGRMGGYQKFENFLKASATPENDYSVFLDPTRLDRACRYVGKYGGGGPNKRLRQALPDALRRAGIVVNVG